MPTPVSRSAAAPRRFRPLPRRGVLGPLVALVVAVLVFVGTVSLIVRVHESRAPVKVAKA